MKSKKLLMALMCAAFLSGCTQEQKDAVIDTAKAIAVEVVKTKLKAKYPALSGTLDLLAETDETYVLKGPCADGDVVKCAFYIVNKYTLEVLSEKIVK